MSESCPSSCSPSFLASLLSVSGGDGGANGVSNRAAREDHYHYAGTSSGGYSGTVQVVTDVTWTSPILTKTILTLTFLNGSLMSVSSATTSTVFTGEECS